MTVTLTSDQLTDLQADLDVGSAQAIFTDTELNRLFVRANGSYTRTVYMALRQLATSASKWADYTEGQTQEARSDRFQQVRQMMDYWQAEWRAENQAQMIHVRSVPTRRRDKPLDHYPRALYPPGRYADDGTPE